MIRPEAAARLTRWREALIGAAAMALGAWLWLAFDGLPALFALAALLIGVVLVVSGIRAARFRSTDLSPGIVGVDEGRITYMGPLTGGLVELDELTQIAFHRPTTGDAYWRLSHRQGEPLIIPEGAAGSDKLLDALAPLPGLDTGAMVRAVQTRTPRTITVWRRDGLRALT
ncbi:hypothetical protein [Jannaschia donghaensis]|uniref:Uncharacterized protein n=1 Tax=Jannaschia donghaensis TaxID=420998 RepID=A0A0M6YHF6_9RHOB|nr:hypothetical protein [Jannaschia donghaensis]CTQ49788.1 hypothetical protein JDO7802_01805 [Jannaschia donghaensis]